MIEVEKEYSIVSRTEFSDLIFEVFGYRYWKIGAIFLKEFDVSGNLTKLNTCIINSTGFCTKRIKKLLNIREAVYGFVKVDVVHKESFLADKDMIA